VGSLFLSSRRPSNRTSEMIRTFHSHRFIRRFLSPLSVSMLSSVCAECSFLAYPLIFITDPTVLAFFLAHGLNLVLDLLGFPESRSCDAVVCFWAGPPTSFVTPLIAATLGVQACSISVACPTIRLSFCPFCINFLPFQSVPAASTFPSHSFTSPPN
jgi:hypothetical protein